ncbi:hypothetical protein, partial [Flagellimonas marinaquae]
MRSLRSSTSSLLCRLLSRACEYCTGEYCTGNVSWSRRRNQNINFQRMAQWVTEVPTKSYKSTSILLPFYQLLKRR